MPSSSSNLNLSQDPSAIIEGDLALLVRQHLTPEEQKRLPVSRQKQLVEERRNNMVDIGELAEIGERSYIQKERALEEMQSNNVDVSQNEFSFAKRKVFNLKKFAQQNIPMMDEMSPEMPTEMSQPVQDQGLTQKFNDASDLRDYILQRAEQDGDITKVQQEIESLVPEESLEIVRGAFARFIEANTPEETLEKALYLESNDRKN
jgi:hypothetical protein